MATIRDLIGEIRPGAARPAGLDSRLAADLGLDSLVLVELRSRVEEAFGVVLPNRVLDAVTAGEWLAVLRAVRGVAGRRCLLCPGLRRLRRWPRPVLRRPVPAPCSTP